MSITIACAPIYMAGRIILICRMDSSTRVSRNTTGNRSSSAAKPARKAPSFPSLDAMLGIGHAEDMLRTYLMEMRITCRQNTGHSSNRWKRAARFVDL